MSKKTSLKRIAINYKGGKCIVCGYNRCQRALHFHHINSWEKRFNISSKSTWYDIKPELEKCVLLCSNCHSEYHDGIIDAETLLMLSEE